MFHRRAADRTRVALFEDFQVGYDVTFIVSAIVDILYMVIFFICACAEVCKTRQFAVHNDSAVVKSYRTCKAAHTAGCCRHLFFVSKGDSVFRNLQGIDQLNHVQFSVAPDKSCHIAVFFALFVVSNKEQRFDGLGLIQLQEVCHFFDGLCARCVHFFHRQFFHIGLCRRVHAFRSFSGRCHGTAFAVCDFTFADFGKGCKLVGVAAADGAGIRFYRSERQTAAGENSVISVIHGLVAFIKTGVILIERIRVFHDELSASHQAESRSCLVSVLGLNLI